MNKRITTLSLAITAISLIIISKNLLNKNEFTHNESFLVVKEDKVLKTEGDCKQRHSPCATFKIAICLMGFNEGILIDEHNPQYTFKGGYIGEDEQELIQMWQHPNSPSIWMQHNCTWYSQVIMQKIGTEKLVKYVKKFDYGNLDVYITPDHKNPIINCWYEGSLKISAEEQVNFLKKIVYNKLPVSKRATEITKKLIHEGELADGWQIYGRKGNAFLYNIDGTPNIARKGWYVGWIQKQNQAIIFAYYKENESISDYTEESAKQIAQEKLLKLIKDGVIS